MNCTSVIARSLGILQLEYLNLYSFWHVCDIGATIFYVFIEQWLNSISEYIPAENEFEKYRKL